MNTHLLALQLMAAQGLLGAFDTIYHHELTESLAQKQSAKLELAIHAARALIYSMLFVGLSAWEWHGVWSLVLLAVFGVEVILTLWDFVIEDRSRLLPATERITHTVLAINGGAFITLLALNTPAWLAQPTALAWAPHGALSGFLALCGVGVGISGMRDALAALHLNKLLQAESQLQPVSFSDKSEIVLVTGATGFIGQHVVQALLVNGQQVLVLTRHPRQAAWQFGGKVRCIESMSELPPDFSIDVIINLAGARILGPRWTDGRKALLRNSRIGLTQQIVEWIEHAQRKPKLLFSASAIGFYGIQKLGDDAVLTESGPSQPIFMSELCKEWEATAKSARAYGVQVVCMRFGVVFGAQGALPMMTLPIKLGLGGSMGSGKQWISWIHVHDLVRGIAHLWRLHAAGHGLNEEYNFTAPQTVTQKQFSDTAARISRRPSFFPTPALPMRLALGEQADLLLEGQRVVPAALQSHGFVFRYGDVGSALASLL